MSKITEDRWAAFFERIDEAIDRTGRMIVGVPATEDMPEHIPFAYTIGNYLKGLPEILCIGIIESDVFNLWSQVMIARGTPFEDGELVDIGGKFPCLAVKADDPRLYENYTVQVENYSGDQYDVIQMIVPDPTGQLFSKAPNYRDIPCLSSRVNEFMDKYASAPLAPRERQEYFPPEAD